MTCLLLTISMAKITLPLFIYIRREKLQLDSLLAAGASSLSGQWVCITFFAPYFYFVYRMTNFLQ
jgi:hypothetical protein